MSWLDNHIQINSLAHLIRTVHFLKEDEFDYCVRGYPNEALGSKEITKRLSQEQFDYCVREEPDCALHYKHACRRLGDTQFDDCIKRNQERQDAASIFRIEHVVGRMNDYQKMWLLREQTKEKTTEDDEYGWMSPVIYKGKVTK